MVPSSLLVLVLLRHVVIGDRSGHQKWLATLVCNLSRVCGFGEVALLTLFPPLALRLGQHSPALCSHWHFCRRDGMEPH